MTFDQYHWSWMFICFKSNINDIDIVFCITRATVKVVCLMPKEERCVSSFFSEEAGLLDYPQRGKETLYIIFFA